MGFFAIVLLALAIGFLRRAQADPSLLAGAGALWRRAALTALALVLVQELATLVQLALLPTLGLAAGVVPWRLLLASQLQGLVLAALAGWALWQDWRFHRHAGPPPAVAAAPTEPPSLDRTMVGLWRGVVLLTLALLMAGFGLCGGMGVLGGLSSLLHGSSDGLVPIGLGVIGLAIAWALGRREFKPSPPKER